MESRKLNNEEKQLLKSRIKKDFGNIAEKIENLPFEIIQSSECKELIKSKLSKKITNFEVDVQMGNSNMIRLLRVFEFDDNYSSLILNLLKMKNNQKCFDEISKKLNKELPSECKILTDRFKFNTTYNWTKDSNTELVSLNMILEFSFSNMEEMARDTIYIWLNN